MTIIVYKKTSEHQLKLSTTKGLITRTISQCIFATFKHSLDRRYADLD